MRYENRQPPEGINVSSEHPLRTFAKLGLGALVLVVALVTALQLAGGFAAKRIPFELERRVVDRLGIELGDDAASPEVVAYLNDLADRLLAEMDLPNEIEVDVHYDPDETFNAFATAGGQLVFHRGLLEAMPHENALATVMAHEIAHVAHRDPVASLGGGAASALALMVLTGNAGSEAAAGVLREAGLVSSTRFTRAMEREADAAAIPAVARLYGHIDGAAELFEALAAERGAGGERPDGWLERFTSTHPLDADRVRAVEAMADEAELRTEGEVTPLPDGFEGWLEGSAER